MPHFVVAIDGSSKEEAVRNGYPGARVGYLTVASVLVNLTELDRLDEHRPIDPIAFRKTEDAATIDAALPGCNVVTRNHGAAKHAFREELFETFNDVILDEEDRTPLGDTYEVLLALKPDTRIQSCPYEDDRLRRALPDGEGAHPVPVRPGAARLFHGCAAHSRTLPGLGKQR